MVCSGFSWFRSVRNAFCWVKSFVKLVVFGLKRIAPRLDAVQVSQEKLRRRYRSSLRKLMDIKADFMDWNANPKSEVLRFVCLAAEVCGSACLCRLLWLEMASDSC